MSVIEMIEKIIETVKKAGEIYKNAAGNLGIESKGSAVNLVTEYDKKIQDFLFEALSKIIPDCSFLGEEGEGNKELSDGYCFIIDPIDGTTNFIKGFQHSAISVGLAKDKELIAGVVYDPDLDNIYYAEKGKGAYLNGKQIHVSECDLQSSLVLSIEVRRGGSAALDICYVAAGKADLYYELIVRPWDFSGATIILEEAGGNCCTLEKESINCGKASSYLCGNQNNIKQFFRIADEIL